MPTLKSPRRETFAQNIAKQPRTGRTITQCYLDAGFRGQGHGAEVNASKLLSQTEVADRVAEILMSAAKKTRLTVESMIEEAEEARQLALRVEQPGAAVQASALRAKVAGLMVDKVEVGGPGAFDSCTTTEEIAQKLLDQLGLDAALAVMDDIKADMIRLAGDRAREVS